MTGNNVGMITIWDWQKAVASAEAHDRQPVLANIEHAIKINYLSSGGVDGGTIFVADVSQDLSVYTVQ